MPKSVRRIAVLFGICSGMAWAAGCGQRIEVAGGSGGSKLGPPTCMRRFTDGIQVRAPGGSFPLQDIQGMTFDAGGRLFVACRQASRGYVLVFSPPPALDLVQTIGQDDLKAVRDVAVEADGGVFVAEYDGNNPADVPHVHRFDAHGAHLSTWTATASGQGEAYGIAVDGSGRINVGGLVVFRYSAAGHPLDAFGLWGDAPGRIGLARGLAWDPRGFMWIADLARNTVHQFDVGSGTEVIEFGGRGTGAGLFDGTAAEDVRWGPTRLALDSAGDIYANDPFNSRILKLTRQGSQLGEFSFGGSHDVGPIAVDPSSGVLYVGRGTSIDVVCPL